MLNFSTVDSLTLYSTFFCYIYPTFGFFSGLPVLKRTNCMQKYYYLETTKAIASRPRAVNSDFFPVLCCDHGIKSTETDSQRLYIICPKRHLLSPITDQDSHYPAEWVWSSRAWNRGQEVVSSWQWVRWLSLYCVMTACCGSASCSSCGSSFRG